MVGNITYTVLHKRDEVNPNVILTSLRVVIFILPGNVLSMDHDLSQPIITIDDRTCIVFYGDNIIIIIIKILIPIFAAHTSPVTISSGN